MKYITKVVFTLFFIILFSCKVGSKDKQNIADDIIQNDTNKVDTVSYKSNFFRKENEETDEFIKRVYNYSIELNHPIIETNNWIKGKNIILLFFNKELEGDLGINVEGYIYVSTNKKTYHRYKIDSYGPEGRSAKIESIFFANVDTDTDKELIILCSWEQRLKEVAEGKLYQTYIYDDLEHLKDKFQLDYLENISMYFGTEFEGVQEGVEVKAKYKTAKDIKHKLSNLKNKKP